MLGHLANLRVWRFRLYCKRFVDGDVVISGQVVLELQVSSTAGYTATNSGNFQFSLHT